MLPGYAKCSFLIIWVTYFANPFPGPPISAQVLVRLLHPRHNFPVPGLPFWIPTTFLMPFAIARRQKGTHGGLIRAESTRRNPKRGPEGPKKAVPRARLVLSGTNVVKKVGMWVQKTELKRLPCVQCAGHWRRSGTLVWRAVKGRLY